MMIVLFKTGQRDSLTHLAPGDTVVHACPASQPLGIPGLQEFYLEGYAGDIEDLQKITLPEIAASIKSHKRIELL